jgi:hypothetical protein
MKNIMKIFVILITMFCLSSCGISSKPTENNLSNTESSPTIDNVDNNQIDTIETNKINVIIYRSDNLCENYITETVELSEIEALEKTIAIIIDHNNSSDFNIVGYRVKTDEKTNIATIDFRLEPDSQRQLISLSSCEQFALFGSLRQTLINHKPWNIKDIHFLQQGKNIFD